MISEDTIKFTKVKMVSQFGRRTLIKTTYMERKATGMQDKLG